MPAGHRPVRSALAVATLICCVTTGTAAGQQAELLRVSPADVRAHLATHQTPRYPRIAEAAKVEGTVELDVFITQKGTVEAIRTISATPMLEQAAVDAVTRWTFSPFMVDGQPVPVRASLMLVFQLGRTPGIAAGRFEELENALFECETSIRRRQFETAEALCSSAAEAATRLPLANAASEYRARALRIAGIAMLERGRLQDALPTLEQAETASRLRSGFSHENVLTWLVLARAHRSLGTPERAVHAYQQAERQINQARGQGLRGTPYYEERTAELRAVLLELADTLEESGNTRDAERTRARLKSLR